METTQPVEITQPTEPQDKKMDSQDKKMDLLDNNNVDVGIEPKVNGNYTVINLCSFYCICGKR